MSLLIFSTASSALQAQKTELPALKTKESSDLEQSRLTDAISPVVEARLSTNLAAPSLPKFDNLSLQSTDREIDLVQRITQDVQETRNWYSLEAQGVTELSLPDVNMPLSSKQEMHAALSQEARQAPPQSPREVALGENPSPLTLIPLMPTTSPLPCISATPRPPTTPLMPLGDPEQVLSDFDNYDTLSMGKHPWKCAYPISRSEEAFVQLAYPRKHVYEHNKDSQNVCLDDSAVSQSLDSRTISSWVQAADQTDASQAQPEDHKQRTRKHLAGLQCPINPRRFHHTKTLTTHSIESSSACKVCGKTTASECDCNQHEDPQSGTKELICRGKLEDGSEWGCGRRFEHVEALSSHILSETCVKPLLDEAEHQKIYEEQRMDRPRPIPRYDVHA